jgi:hypothetical protein
MPISTYNLLPLENPKTPQRKDRNQTTKRSDTRDLQSTIPHEDPVTNPTKLYGSNKK